MLPERLNKNQKQLVATLEAAGVPFTPEIEAQIAAMGDSPTGKDKTDRGPSSSRESEFLLALMSLERPIKEPAVYKCKQCGSSYSTNYVYEKYCSNDCRAVALADRGIEFDWERPHGERFWPTVPSVVIAPAELKRLKNWAEAILNQVAEIERESSQKPAERPQHGFVALG